MVSEIVGGVRLENIHVRQIPVRMNKSFEIVRLSLHRNFGTREDAQPSALRFRKVLFGYFLFKEKVTDAPAP